MKEELILFHTAKLAKEKGFNSWSSHYYESSSNIKNLPSCEKITQNGLEKNQYLASTQSLLQKYLRERHNISVEITTDHSGWTADIESIPFKNYPESCLKSIEDGFETYEEALEAGLQEALKLIK